MTTLQTLIAARELLSDPARWTRKYSALDANGIPPEDIADGVCFCALGAIWRTIGFAACSDAEQMLSAAVRFKTQFHNIPTFNDDPATTHADVLRIYDLAIKRARQS